MDMIHFGASTPLTWPSLHVIGSTMELHFGMGKTGRILLLKGKTEADWTGETIDKVITLYAGTRIGGWLHRQKVSHGEQAYANCTKPDVSIFDVDLAAFGFAAGWAEDLRFAREAWEHKDPYWLESA